jgi:hypothetical protein
MAPGTAPSLPGSPELGGSGVLGVGRCGAVASLARNISVVSLDFQGRDVIVALETSLMTGKKNFLRRSFLQRGSAIMP